MTQTAKPKVVGLNHIALEVGDLDQALEFYGRIFDFEMRGRAEGMAFLDMGDQFIALIEGRSQSADAERHFGLVVDDRSRIPDLVRAAGGAMIEGDFMDFRDPWGNRIQVVEYGDLQFSKTPAVLKRMGLSELEKSSDARDQLRKKGML